MTLKVAFGCRKTDCSDDEMRKQKKRGENENKDCEDTPQTIKSDIYHSVLFSPSIILTCKLKGANVVFHL